ncbi:2-nitropropane dioxygenase [Russula vinacea]|nr:2-nitropropane dioxygenase [Russula vinacea]
MSVISTPITALFGIQHPILLAGMNVAAGPELAAAVTNAGGLGVIGGVGYTPNVLRQQIKALKKDLKDPNAPFGVDLLLPQVGGSARKTNHDYTRGQLPDLIDVIIEEKTRLFVSAVGVPPPGILIMNMIGHPKHVKKALDVGGRTSPLTGQPIWVVGAGAVYDGRGLAANLVYGAQAVWVGTRFVASEEAGATRAHKAALLSADHGDVVRTLIYTGRPLRVRKTPYVEDWEQNRQAEISELTAKGIIPNQHEVERHPEKSVQAVTFLMGDVAALIKEVLPARTIVDNMVNDAAKILQDRSKLVSVKTKL